MIRVIKIINENEIILNAGGRTSENVNYGDILEIYAESEQSIIDPFSGKDLGKPLFIKATVTPKYINSEFCICQNSKNGLDAFGRVISGAAFSNPLPLKVKTEDISGGFDDISSKEICVGDYARILSHMKTE